jgi:hypothetical protein
MAAHPFPAQENTVDLEEILSYECARSVATMVERGQQLGPVFSDGGLVFTSTETQKGGRVLILNAGAGTYAVNLSSAGVNRIRFEIPTQDSNTPKAFYLSYMHDGVFRSRYFDFGEVKPPAGRDELDYAYTNAQRAEYMLPHLEYAIYQTSENALNSLAEGGLQRYQMSRRKVENCDHISRKTPELARNLLHNLDVLELIVMGPAVQKSDLRMPASVHGP